MRINEFLFKHKIILSISSALILVIGIIITYIYYGTEPWETVGGFICGIGFGLFITFMSLKQVNKSS